MPVTRCSLKYQPDSSGSPRNVLVCAQGIAGMAGRAQKSQPSTELGLWKARDVQGLFKGNSCKREKKKTRRKEKKERK